MSDAARAGSDGGSGRLPPEVLVGGRFRTETHLRTEGETEVYQATDAQTGQPASLRLYSGARAAGVLAALEISLRKREGLAHRNLTALLAFGQHEDSVFIATELEDGHTLRQLIDARAQQGEAIGLGYAQTLLGHLASGLSEAHKVMSHGGLHPQSIWVSRAGRVKIDDLGLARALPALAGRGGPDGAPPGIYMAPELARGMSPSPSTDVYSLGAILYELVTGAPPPGASSVRPASQVRNGIPPALDAIIAKALSANPAIRYATPKALVDALGSLAPADPATAAAPAARDPAAPQAAPVGESVSIRVTLGHSFDVAEAAGLGGDDQRWLVQKDRLDFGPFSLAQVRGQLERAAFTGENLIVDADSGERVKIKDHPELAEFVRATDRKLEAMRREQAEHAHVSVERKKSRATVLIVGALVAALGVGAFFYLKNRGKAEDEVLASRVAEADIDAFIKTVKFDFAQKKRGGRRGGSGGRGDEFSGNQNLGDVTKNGGDEVLGDNVIQQVMLGRYRSLVPCIMEERRKNPGLSDVEIEFVVLGSGKVSAVRVNGQRNGGFSSCVYGRMQSFGFPKFNGARTVASWSLSMK